MGSRARHHQPAATLSFIMGVLPLVSLCALGACNLSSVTGQSGQVSFGAQNCGAVLNGLPGCDLKRPLAQGGSVDVTATLQKDGTPVAALSTDNPQVLGLSSSGTIYTVVGLSPGQANLLAVYDPQKGPDQVSVQVEPIGSLNFTAGLSSGNGSYSPMTTGDADGTFTVNPGLMKFSLFYGQQDGQGNQVIGRSSFTYDLGGLTLQGGPPTGLEFDLLASAAGSYIVTVKAKAGMAQIRTKIVVTM